MSSKENEFSFTFHDMVPMFQGGEGVQQIILTVLTKTSVEQPTKSLWIFATAVLPSRKAPQSQEGESPDLTAAAGEAYGTGRPELPSEKAQSFYGSLDVSEQLASSLTGAETGSTMEIGDYMYSDSIFL